VTGGPPQHEAAVRAIVRAAVFLAQTDGSIAESEVETLVDSLRKHLGATVGPEDAPDVTVSTLIDEARKARRLRATVTEADYLSSVAKALDGPLRSAAVAVAVDVARADGKSSAAEGQGLARLCAALGVDVPSLG